MQCQVKGCENEATTGRVIRQDLGAIRTDVTVQLCGDCAAAAEAGEPLGEIDFTPELFYRYVGTPPFVTAPHIVAGNTGWTHCGLDVKLFEPMESGPNFFGMACEGCKRALVGLRPWP